MLIYLIKFLHYNSSKRKAFRNTIFLFFDKFYNTIYEALYVIIKSIQTFAFCGIYTNTVATKTTFHGIILYQYKTRIQLSNQEKGGY